jgi:hypothetical protein
MVIASRSIARQIVARLADVPNACCSSANVRSGCSVINVSKRGRSGVKMGVRHRVCRRGAISPDSRRRCFTRRTHDALTRYFSATASAVIPTSLSCSTRVRKSIEYAAIGTSSARGVPCGRTTYK